MRVLKIAVFAVACASLLALFVMRGAEADEPFGFAEPVYVEKITAQPYGHFVGDVADIEFVVVVSPKAELDLSNFPKEGTVIGKFIVRKRTVLTEPFFGGGRVFIRLAVQNFAVLEKQGDEALGPLELMWRIRGTNEWFLLEIGWVAIRVSPMTLPDERFEEATLNEAPRDMMPISRDAIGWVLVVLGAFVSMSAGAAFVRIVLEARRRRSLTPIYRALQNLSKKNIAPEQARAIFRTMLREKFGAWEADSMDDIARKLCACGGNGYWVPVADATAGLWEQATAVRYERRAPGPRFVEDIRAHARLLYKMEQNESFGDQLRTKRPVEREEGKR